jgi:voltage-gated potassium channel
LTTIIAIALAVAIYFLIPLDHGTDAGSVAQLALGLLAFVAVLTFQLRQIVRSDHPSIRGRRGTCVLSSAHHLRLCDGVFLMTHADTSTFGGPMTRTDLMYVSTTVFTTVGFGDITAKSQAARVVVTAHMFLDLVIIGLVARLVVDAVKVGKQSQVG